MNALAQLTLDRNAKATRALADTGQRIARRIASLWFHKRGQDISGLIPELAEEATAGLGFAMARDGVPLSALIGNDLPRPVIREAFSQAQRVLRRMSRETSVDVVSWDDAMALADAPEKPVFVALCDTAELRIRRAAIIAKARAMIRAARAFHKVNPSRKRDAALRADLRNIRRATAYMIRHVLGDSLRPFEFRFSMRWNPEEKSMMNAARETFQLTAKRITLGTLALR